MTQRLDEASCKLHTITTTTQHNTLTMVGVGEDVDNYFAPQSVVIMVYLCDLVSLFGQLCFFCGFGNWTFCVFFSVDSVSTLLEVGVRHFCGRIRPVTWRQALGPLVGCGRGRIP